MEAAGGVAAPPVVEAGAPAAVAVAGAPVAVAEEVAGAGRNRQTAQTMRLLLLQKEKILSRLMGLDYG